MVLPALNLTILDAGILKMVQQVGLVMFSLNMVDFSMAFLLLSSCWTGFGLGIGGLVIKGLGPGLDNTNLLTLTDVGDGGHTGDEPELGVVKHHELAIGCETVIALVGQTAAIASNVLKMAPIIGHFMRAV